MTDEDRIKKLEDRVAFLEQRLSALWTHPALSVPPLDDETQDIPAFLRSNPDYDPA